MSKKRVIYLSGIFLKSFIYSLLIFVFLTLFVSGLKDQSAAACNSCKLVLTVEGSGTITIINNKNKSTYSVNGGRLTSVFAAGTEIKVKAEAADGWNFAGWEGSIISKENSKSTENPIVILIEKDVELKAVFNKNK